MILTPLTARVTFPRVKSLARLLSLLNFTREAATKFLTGSLSKEVYVGQSGHCSKIRAEGTVHREESTIGTVGHIKKYKGESRITV